MSRARLITFFALLALVIAAVPGSMLLRRAANGARVTPVDGGLAPDFTLTGLDGRPVHLADLQGRPVLLNFWASWCTPCRDEFKVLSAASREHARDRLAVVGVVFRDLQRDARDFVSEQQAAWPSGFDSDGTVARAYGVDELPQSFFIRPDGRVLSHVFGGLTKQIVDRQVTLALR